MDITKEHPNTTRHQTYGYMHRSAVWSVLAILTELHSTEAPHALFMFKNMCSKGSTGLIEVDAYKNWALECFVVC